MAKETEQGSFIPMGGPNPTEASLDQRPSLFLLNPGIYFATGAKNGAVYDTDSGNVYSLNQAGTQVILGQNQNPDFTKRLAKELRINRLAKPTPINKEKPSIDLDFVWFEILSDDCNERCVHCYAESMPPSYRRALEIQTSAVNSDNKQKLTAKDWKRLIDESFALGCKQCQFIGGEPFLWRGENGETVLDLAKRAEEIGFETVEIFTNATLITEAIAQRIKDLGLRVAVSVYSSDENTHEAITRTRGSFRKTMQALHMLKELGVPTRVETVLMKQNQNTVEETDRMIADMGFSHRTPDVLRPNGRGGNQELYPDAEIAIKYSLKMEPNFSANPDFIKKNIDMHSCLAGKITITDTGDVLPCIFSRGQTTGNVREAGSIENILRSDLQNIWRITKDDVLVCKDCEYRYVCFDCRPISEGANEGRGDYRTSPYPRCTYNPYEGAWGKGTWKIDEKGKSYYDTNLNRKI